MSIGERIAYVIVVIGLFAGAFGISVLLKNLPYTLWMFVSLGSFCAFMVSFIWIVKK